MALRGTIDTFALTDVLALLAASSKTGRLVVQGDRGSAQLAVDAGHVVGGEGAADAVAEPSGLVFELLRFADASFDFDAADELGPDDHSFAPAPLQECLDRAIARMEEWRGIERVVPSQRHTVHLVHDLDGGSVTLDAEQWPLVVAAGEGVPVGELPARLDLDEFTACSRVAALVGDGVLVVAEPGVEQLAADPLDRAEAGDPPTATGPVGDGGGHEDVAEDLAEPGSDVPGDGPSGSDGDAAVGFPDRFPIDDLLGSDAGEVDDPWSSPEMERLEAQRLAAAQSFEGIELEALPLDGPLDEPLVGDAREAEPDSELDPDPPGPGSELSAAGDETTDEVLRQMSRLSPQAAQAIAAALNAPDTGGPIDEDRADGVAGGADPHRGSSDGDDGPVSYAGRF